MLQFMKRPSCTAKKARSHTVRTKPPLLSARGSSLQCGAVCSSSLGRLLTGTWQRPNINKFPAVGWQAGRCGAVPPCYHTCTAQLSPGPWPSALGSAAVSRAQHILKAQVLLKGAQPQPPTPHQRARLVLIPQVDTCRHVHFSCNATERQLCASPPVHEPR